MAETRQLPAVVPMLAYEDPATAIDWLTTAFGFREQRERRSVAPDGRVTHAQLEAGDGIVMVANPTPDYHGPARHRTECPAADRWLSVPWVVDGVFVNIAMIDDHFNRAREAGARMLSGIEPGPDGRLYRVEDLEGHRWMFYEPGATSEASGTGG